MTNTNILKLLRGDILSFIYNVFPQIVKDSNIISAYYEYYAVKDIQRSIYYLVERGFLVEEKRTNPIHRGKKDSFFNITAEGMAIVERTAEDPGIYIEEEKD